jgi:muconolactone delta-isomerase
MNVFQVNISLPRQYTEEFISLLPQQRRIVNELLQKKILESYAVSADKTKAWAAVNAETEKEVRDILSTFPLIRFMKIEVTQLAFYNQVQLAFPPLMLN